MPPRTKRVAETPAQTPDAAPDRTPFERSITIDDRIVPVVVQPLATGFDVLVPIRGGTSTVYGDTEGIALDAARDRLRAAATEFAEDRIKLAFGSTVEVASGAYDVTVTTYVSGKVEIIAEAFPEIEVRVADEATGMERMAELIAERIGLREARTVDGQPGEVEIDEPNPYLGISLPPISLAKALQLLAEAEADRAEKHGIASKARAEAKKADERVESAMVVMRQAAEREVKPTLPLEQAAS